jgi:Tat protein translocase TatB subunit
MFGFGFVEILVILTVILLVLGPEKLPEFTRTLGRLSYQLRSTADEFRREVSFSSLGIDQDEIKKELEDIRKLPDDCPEDAKANEQEQVENNEVASKRIPLDQQVSKAAPAYVGDREGTDKE